MLIFFFQVQLKRLFQLSQFPQCTARVREYVLIRKRLNSENINVEFQEDYPAHPFKERYEGGNTTTSKGDTSM